MPVTYPPRNTTDWDIPLKDYIDDIVTRVRNQLPGRGGINRLEALGPLFAALARRETTPCRIVFLGSSSTAGSNATPEANRWVNVVARRGQNTYPSGTGTEPAVRTLNAAADTPSSSPGIQVINGGEAGTTSANYAPGGATYGIGLINPDLVVHTVGAIDSIAGASYVSPSQYLINMGNVLDTIETVSSSGTPVCHLLVHGYRRSGVTLAEWAEYGKVLETLASTRSNVAFLDLSQSFEAAGHGATDTYDVIDMDGVNLNNNGHAMVGFLVADALGFHGSPIPGSSGSGGGTALLTTFTPSGGLSGTTVQAALTELDAEKVARVETFTSVLASTLHKVELNFLMATGSANLSEVWNSGKIASWTNEWGALRGTSPYSWGDALVRGIREDGDGIVSTQRCFIELVDRRAGAYTPEPKSTIWGISWATGTTIQNGIEMANTWVRATPTTPIPVELPANTLVVTLPTGP